MKKRDCGTCGHWYEREEITYKPNPSLRVGECCFNPERTIRTEEWFCGRWEFGEVLMEDKNVSE